jgi:UDP-N-acetylglucosamine acyltransferase
MPVDPSAILAPTARVHPEAVIGANTRVGDYAVIESDVVIGAGCLIEPYVFIKRWTTMGDGNEISAYTALGTDPLDKNFTGQRSYLRIGSGNKIREHYTVSRGTQPESVTVIGNGNYVMTAGHIAHNCVIGDNTVICSNALIAGYVEVESQAFISGGALVHQFGKIGRLAMVSGNARVNQDLPPFFTYAGTDDIQPHGLNLVGLRRAGFTPAMVKPLKLAYHYLYRAGLKLEAALDRIEREASSTETMHLIHFVRSSKRGIVRR